MGPKRLLAVTAAVAVTGTMMLTLSPSQGTDAQWREEITAPATGPMSDTFGMVATASDGPVPTWNGSNGIANSSQITLKNESTRHSSWVNVRSTRLNKVVGGDGNDILTKMKLDYKFGAGSCNVIYWNARNHGSISEGTTYSRPQDKVVGASLDPGMSGVLCPVVELNYTGANSQRDALLNHAGRAVDVTTVVNQKSEAPATWASGTETATSRYRIAMPPPQKPADSSVCRITNSSGNPNALIKFFGGFFWGWPDAVTSDDRTTPAMAGGWEIFRQDASGAWKSFATGYGEANGRDRRQRAGINSNDIDRGLSGKAVRSFKLRGYPYAGNKDSFVESDWIARAYEDGDRWACDDPLPNPSPHAGPHNMP